MAIQRSRLTDRYGWNERAARYTNLRTGRFVSTETVKIELERYAQTAAANMRAVSQRLVQRQISLAEWQLAMEREIKAVHIASAAAARGGWAQMSPSDWGWVGVQVRRQYDYLQRFAAQIETGRQPLNGRVPARAAMYGKAGHVTYEEMRRRHARDRGLGRERRVLGYAEHCPDCVVYAARGWQPIGSLPRIGDSRCLTNCMCHFEFE